MKLSHRLLAVSLTSALLAACNISAPTPPATDAAAGPATGPQTALGRTVEKAMEEARKELATENITLNTGFSIGAQSHRGSLGNLPKAEISPAGDLLIEGKPVVVDASQRALLLTYRGQVVSLAETGMALGVQGADMGVQAAGAAIAGILSGNPDKIGARVEAQESKIKAEAMKLCNGLPPMLVTQAELAKSVPEFAPYAKLTQADIDDCMSKDGDASRAEIRDEIRREIRDEIRQGVRTGVREAVGAREPTANAAAEAEAASKPTQ